MVFGQEGANTYVCTPEIEAQMAELVDASDSKSGFRKKVQVRFLFWALFNIYSLKPALAAGFLVR